MSVWGVEQVSEISYSMCAALNMSKSSEISNKRLKKPRLAL